MVTMLAYRLQTRLRNSPYRLDASVGIIGGDQLESVPQWLWTNTIYRLSFGNKVKLFQSIASYTEGKQIYSLPKEWQLPREPVVLKTQRKHCLLPLEYGSSST